MNAAAASVLCEEIDSQWSGYWLDPDRQPQATQPPYRPTGAILRRIGEKTRDEFVCLDLVRVETTDGFAWLPLSEAGRYTYAHSLGLLRKEKWRLAIWNGSALSIYEAEYADSLAPDQLAPLYGAEAQGRARPDRPAVQLRLRLVRP
jgi:hypothetical protein